MSSEGGGQCGAQGLGFMDSLATPVGRLSSFTAFPSAPLSLLLASSLQAQEMWGRHSPATRLIDGEVKLPYVQHRELMGFLFFRPSCSDAFHPRALCLWSSREGQKRTRRLQA